jgi:BlaI family transcriptional regulator, penicillinase repressor
VTGKPTELELKVLNRLWGLGGVATVREVLAHWDAAPVPRYTTVLKVFQIMEAKGFVSHHKEGRAYRYTALLRNDEHSRSRLREILHGLYRGDRLRLVNALVDELDLDPQEIRAVRKMLTAKSGRKRT